MKLSFVGWNPYHVGLTEAEARSLVELFYRFEKDVVLHGEMKRDFKKNAMGLHEHTLLGKSLIYVDPDVIRSRVGNSRTGGNLVVSSFRLAVGCVLAHEIQHANQASLHRGNEQAFYGQRQRYESRACEREARQFADDSIPTIRAVLGEQGFHATFHPPPAADLLADLFDPGDVVPFDEVVDLLRSSGLNNARDRARLLSALSGSGVSVV